MPGILPNSPTFRVVNFESNYSAITDVSVSSRSHSRGRPNQLFSFKVDYPSLTKGQASEIYAFLMRQHGTDGTFDIVLPQKTPRGAMSGAPAVGGQFMNYLNAANVTNEVFSVAGFSNATVSSSTPKIGAYKLDLSVNCGYDFEPAPCPVLSGKLLRIDYWRGPGGGETDRWAKLMLTGDPLIDGPRIDAVDDSLNSTDPQYYSYKTRIFKYDIATTRYLVNKTDLTLPGTFGEAHTSFDAFTITASDELISNGQFWANHWWSLGVGATIQDLNEKLVIDGSQINTQFVTQSQVFPGALSAATVTVTFTRAAGTIKFSTTGTASEVFSLGGTYTFLLTPSVNNAPFVIEYDQDFIGEITSVSATPLSSGNLLAVSGATPNVIDWAKPGDVFKPAGDLKVYMVVESASSSPGGNVCLVFEPPLIRNPVQGEQILVSNVPFRVRLASSVHSYTVEPGLEYGLSFDVVEAI